MRIGLFTDTYFPQVSGDETSIRTLKTQLEKMGHNVFIFTTTDRDVDRYEDWQIIRIPSVPFFAFNTPRPTHPHQTAKGLIFLLIFESGHSRYLIQFLPIMLFMSGIGLSSISYVRK